MENKMMVVNKHDLCAISRRLANLRETLSLTMDAMEGESVSCSNVMFHTIDSITSILNDLEVMMNAVTADDEAVQYLWNRMLETGKTQFTLTDIHGLTNNSKLLPTAAKAKQALKSLESMGRIYESKISPRREAPETESLCFHAKLAGRVMEETVKCKKVKHTV